MTLSLQCTNPRYNHWKLDPLPLDATTNQKVADLLLLAKEKIFNPPHQLTPTIYFLSPETGRKVRALMSKEYVYLAQSKKEMEKPDKYSGNFKTGRDVVRTPPSPLPLLFVKNNRQETYLDVKRDIEVASALSENVSTVQKPLEIFSWISRRENSKIGYVCLKQKEDLFDLIANEIDEPTFPRLPLPHRRSFQLQMTSILKQVSEQGYLYRDCKLENFLISDDSKTLTLIDFDMCSKEMCEPKKAKGTVSTLAPEYALLVRLINSDKGYKPPLEVVSSLVNEKNTVFSLGIVFLFMSFYHSPLPHLSLLADLCIKGDRIPHLMYKKSQWVPLEFRDFLHKLDPKMPQDMSLPKTPILEEKRPSSVDSWTLLLEKMVTFDPRQRPTLAEVEIEIQKIIQEEAKRETT